MSDQEQLVERLTHFYRETRGEVQSTPPHWVPGKPRTMRWLQPALASVALIAVAAGLAVTVRTVRDEAPRKPPPVVGPSPLPSPSPSPSLTPSPTPSPSATPSWVTRLVSIGPVTTMSLDNSAIFALYAPAPVSGGIDPSRMRLARIDRSTGSVTTAGDFPYATTLARVTAGLWVAAGPGVGDGTPAADSNWLTLLDPVTLSVKQPVHLPGQSTSQSSAPQLDGTSSLLWLGYGQSLYRLDPTAAGVLFTAKLPGTATSISVDSSGHRLYVGVEPTPSGLNQDLVVEWDAVTGARIASAPTGGIGLGGPKVAAAPDGVWIAYATGMMGAVEHRSASDLTLLPEPPARHANGIHVFVGGGTLWLVDIMTHDVACADLRTGAIAASSSETFPQVLAADANGSYLGTFDGVGFLRPDPSCPH